MRQGMLVENVFDLQTVNDTLDKLNISQVDNEVITKFNNSVICKTGVSSKYGLFDFSSVAGGIVNNLGNSFVPEKYKLKITGGIQELRLTGEKFKIGDDIFLKMISILNSTNKQIALQMNVGLFRQICKNGAIIGTKESCTIRSKHYKNLIFDKKEIFISNLSSVNKIISNQTNELRSIYEDKKPVLYKDFMKRYLFDEDNQKIESHVNNVKKFNYLLTNSKTDNIRNQLSNEQYRALRFIQNPLDVINNIKDFEMSKKDVFNVYMEVFNDRDSSEIRKNTNKILTYLN